jgi:hypothetical protein
MRFSFDDGARCVADQFDETLPSDVERGTLLIGASTVALQPMGRPVRMSE